MKKCTWCGKESPEEATICPLDQHALVSCTPSASSSSEGPAGFNLPWQIVVPTCAWLLAKFLLFVFLGHGTGYLLNFVLASWAAVDCSKMGYRGSRVLGLPFKPIVVFAVCAFFLWDFGFIWYLVMRHRVMTSTLPWDVENENPPPSLSADSPSPS